MGECKARSVSRRAFTCGAAALALGICGCAHKGPQGSGARGSAVKTHRVGSSDARSQEQDAQLNQALAAAGDAIRALVDPLGDAVSVELVPLDPQTYAQMRDRVEIAPGTSRVAASIIKLPILACALERAAAGVLVLDEQLVMRADQIVGGSGTIAVRGAGTAFTVDELLHAMIAQSDNTAANMLIDRLGFDAVNATVQDLGCSSTVLARKMMDTAAEAEGRENYTSAADAARILAAIASGTIATPELCERARGYLLDQADTRGIAEGVPAGTAVAHKTGSLSAAQHDAAIVYAERPFILVVLTERLDREQALALERDIAAAACANLR